MRAFGVKPRLRVMTSQRIDTERLFLRSPVSPDAPEISRLLGSWQVARWLVRIPFPYRTEHADAWIARSAEERAAGVGWPFLIMLRETNAMIGSIDLSLEPGPSNAALGYWLGEDYWGCGYATEAALAMLSCAFEILNLERVTASALPENARSIHVLEKAGLVHVDRRSEDTVERGQVDTEFFVLDRPVWRARR